MSGSQDAFKAALTQTGIFVAAALVFCAGVFLVQGQEAATAWFAAYILEESLSIDNLFVFSLIFDYFQTPLGAQPRVLKWGLIVAVVLRAAFIFAGLAIVEQFKGAPEPAPSATRAPPPVWWTTRHTHAPSHPPTRARLGTGVLLVFAGILLYSSYQLFFEDEDEEEDLSQNAVVQLTKKYLPSTDVYDGEKFITAAPGATGESAGAAAGLLDGSSVVTPLLLALVVVEVSDVLFAVDSIPAVFGVTTDPFIAFTSNGFAILGLRALYTIVAQVTMLPPHPPLLHGGCCCFPLLRSLVAGATPYTCTIVARRRRSTTSSTCAPRLRSCSASSAPSSSASLPASRSRRPPRSPSSPPRSAAASGPPSSSRTTRPRGATRTRATARERSDAPAWERLRLRLRSTARHTHAAGLERHLKEIKMRDRDGQYRAPVSV